MTKTKREQLAALQAEMAEEQAEAAQEFNAIINSSEMQSMLASIDELRERAIPGQPLDSAIENLKTVIASVRHTIPIHYPAA